MGPPINRQKGNAMTDEVFEESAEIPTGRKARTISETLRHTLKDAAKRGVAFSRVGSEDEIDELRKDLNSAAVRAEFEVTIGTAHLEDGSHKLTFGAKRKPAPKAAKEGTQV
jgi:hypothetical protein